MAKPDFKTCKKCERYLPKEDFYQQKGYFVSPCKRCRIHQMTRREYGITQDVHEAMLARGCDACGSFQRLSVDHDHQTGTVRGILCIQCNTSLGLLNESVDRMEALIRYTEAHCG